ncbi:MAG: UxaA family hydrolase [Anaerolineae bacterium]
MPRLEFEGYRRPNGRVGVRNHVLIIPAVVCAGHVAQRIADQLEGVVAVTHQHGCSQIGADRDLTLHTLVGYASNPNVAAALVVGLGCEAVPAQEVAQGVASQGQRVETLIFQIDRCSLVSEMV